MKSYTHCNEKINLLKNRRVFLLRCRKNGIYPNNIIQGTKIYSKLMTKSDSILRKIQYNQEKAKNKLLNIEISITIHELKIWNGQLEYTKKIIQNYNIILLVKTNFFTTQENRLRRYNEVNKTKYSNKFMHLVNKQHELVIPTFNNRHITNISSTEIPDIVMTCLSYGPKFGVDIEFKDFKTVIPKLIADIESVITTQTDKDNP
jgi:hypothetical protein